MTDNPYATPAAKELHAASNVDAEHATAIRQALRSTERLVRSIGIVYFLQAVFVLAMTAMLILNAPDPEGDAGLLLSTALYAGALVGLLAVAGYGLTTLALWSRFCALVQTIYLLGGFMFGLYTLKIDTQAGFFFALMHVLPFYILFAPRAGYVLSFSYAQVVAATRGRPSGTVPLAFGIFALLAALMLGDAWIEGRL